VSKLDTDNERLRGMRCCACMNPDAMSEVPILSCGDCGACCMEMCSPPFVPPDTDQLPPDVKSDYQHGLEGRDEAGWPDCVPCFWLDPDSKKCRHYEHRPDICRDFEMGSDECRAWRGRLTACDQAAEEDG